MWRADLYMFVPGGPEGQVCPELSFLGAKDWWRLVTIAYSPTEKALVTWEQFTEMFCIKCVLLAERERLAQE